MPVNEPGTLQPAPPGLLSLLNLKQRGANPDALGSSVQPVVDLSHWYGLDRAEVLTVDTTVTRSQLLATVFNSSIQVPNDQIWWVRSYTPIFFSASGTVTALAIQQFAAAVQFRQLSPIGVVTQMVGESVGPIAHTPPIGGNFFVPAPSMRDFWAPPGTLFGAFVGGTFTDPTNNGAIRSGLLFDRLLI